LVSLRDALTLANIYLTSHYFKN